jgi:hypothetical protein
MHGAGAPLSTMACASKTKRQRQKQEITLAGPIPKLFQPNSPALPFHARARLFYRFATHPVPLSKEITVADDFKDSGERFFEIVMQSGHVACVIQAVNPLQAIAWAKLVQHQLEPPVNFDEVACTSREASFPFTAPTFSSGYFQILAEVLAAQKSFMH